MLSDAHKLFIAAADTGSFSAAARQLHKTPSAVSKQIQALEDKLSVKLFERTTRSLQLTEAGHYYLERCKRLVAEFEAANKELEEFNLKQDGCLHITLSASISGQITRDILAPFSEKFKDIRYELNVTNDNLELIDNRIDFAFRQGPLKNNSSQIGIQLFEMNPVICASPDFVERFGRPSSLDALFSLPLALPSYINMSQKLRPFFTDINWLRLDRAHRASDIHTLVDMGVSGISAIFGFKHMLHEQIAEGQLIDITPLPQVPSIPVYLVYQANLYQSVAKKAFIDLVKRHYL